MVEYSVRSEIVNVMQMARRHGHGRVKHALDFRGVARSSAYRWEGQVRWLLEEGPEELRRLRRELARATAELAEQSPAPAGPAKDAKGERDLMVEAAVLGNSDAAITDLLFRARGHRLSHETVRAEVAERGAVARVAFERYFAGVGTVGAADEIFLGHGLGLFIVEPTSLLISGARRAESRTAEDWRPVLAKMEALELGISDAGAGVTAAIEERGVARGADLFHLEGKPQAWLARREKAVGAHWAAVEKARRVLERPPGLPGRPPKLRVANYAEAREAADREVAEWCRLGDLYAEARATADYLTPDGQLNTPRRADERLGRVLAAMEETEEGKGLAAALGAIRPTRTWRCSKRSSRGFSSTGPTRSARCGWPGSWRRRSPGGGGTSAPWTGSPRPPQGARTTSGNWPSCGPSMLRFARPRPSSASTRGSGRSRRLASN